MYFRIGHSSDLKEIGHYPQVKFRKGYNPRLNGVYKVRKNEFPDFIPNYELELESNAIPTSLLPNVGASFGLIVNKELKEILSKHKLPPHHFYKMKVLYHDEVLEYYWLHYIVNDFWDHIDKEKSFGEVYTVKKGIFTIHEEVKTTSKEEVLEIRKNLKLPKMFRAKTIFKPSFPSYDLYETDLTNDVFISAKLKNAMEDSGMTGMVFSPYDKVEIQN